MPDSTCPGPETLAGFAAGDLPEPEYVRVADHVASCERCQAALPETPDAADGLLDALHALPQSGSETVEVPAKLLEAACAAGIRSGSSVVFDSGRRLARDLERGPVEIGRFRLVAEVGVGSFGHVFEAVDTELDRTVAIKVQRAGFLDAGEGTDRFLREARSAAQLQHPNIVGLYETGQTEDGTLFLVTEFVEGRTLDERLRQRGFPAA